MFQTLALHKKAGHGLPADTTLETLLRHAKGAGCFGLTRARLELLGRGPVPEYQGEEGDDGEDDEAEDSGEGEEMGDGEADEAEDIGEGEEMDE